MYCITLTLDRNSEDVAYRKVGEEKSIEID
jgi:hypothetical protein